MKVLIKHLNGNEKHLYHLFMYGWSPEHLELHWILFFLHQHLLVSHFFIQPHFEKSSTVPIDGVFVIGRWNISLKITSSANI